MNILKLFFKGSFELKDITHPLRFTCGDDGLESNREEIILAKSFRSVLIDQYLIILEMNGSLGL